MLQFNQLERYIYIYLIITSLLPKNAYKHCILIVILQLQEYIIKKS